jgi:hypothetical protein
LVIPDNEPRPAGTVVPIYTMYRQVLSSEFERFARRYYRHPDWELFDDVPLLPPNLALMFPSLNSLGETLESETDREILKAFVRYGS